MFGALDVQILSLFTGGELIVRHAGKIQEFDFAVEADV